MRRASKILGSARRQSLQLREIRQGNVGGRQTTGGWRAAVKHFVLFAWGSVISPAQGVLVSLIWFPGKMLFGLTTFRDRDTIGIGL
jgi:hypothetical protein